MAIFDRSEKEKNIEVDASHAPVIKIDSIYRGLNYLVELVKQIRPSKPGLTAEAELKFKALFYQLNNDKILLFSLRKAFLSQFLQSNFIPAITESGLVRSRGFVQEITMRIKHKMLPPLQQPNDFLFIINHIFYKNGDDEWVSKIDRELWVNFFRLLGVQVKITNPVLIKQLHAALNILCKRVVSLGLEKEITDHLPGLEYDSYPFIQLDKAVEAFFIEYERDHNSPLIPNLVEQIESAIRGCLGIINQISEQRKKQGTSLSQTYILFSIQQQLERLFIICEVLNNHPEFYGDRFLDFFIRIIHLEKKKNSLRDFLSANLSFIAYKITEHGGIRGQKYITTTRKEYWQMFRSAMLGGFIISFTGIIKNIIIKWPLAPFWQGFAFSANYFAGFQIMHEAKATLATKQPAFTASAFAASLNTREIDGHPDLYNLAITTARAVRSQAASFAGNLLLVLPTAYLLAAAYKYFTGEYLVTSEAAHKMLLNQHPFQSLSILFACITGFFLFASGLVAGYVENGMNYGKVGERLKNHPGLKNTIAPKRLERWVRYVETHLGAFMGNLSLGFFLGMAGFIGVAFGIPFDIRHITISAANTSIAYFTQGSAESLSFMMEVFAGLMLIGFFNFLVSFLLAFFVALKSRGVHLRDYPQFAAILGRFLLRYPTDFFYAPKKPRMANDVRQKISQNLMP